MRRDLLEATAGQERLTRWCQGWIERSAEIFRLNEAQLEQYDPDRKPQTAAFKTATREPRRALDGLLVDAEAELALRIGAALDESSIPGTGAWDLSTLNATGSRGSGSIGRVVRRIAVRKHP